MKDQNAPQRSLSAYMLFSNKNRKIVQKNNPDIAVTELMKQVAQMWNETDEKTRSPFMKQAAKGKVRYEKEMEAYRQTDSYHEFQKKKKTHDLIAKYAAKIPGAKKEIGVQNFSTRSQFS